MTYLLFWGVNDACYDFREDVNDASLLKNAVMNVVMSSPP